MKKILCWLLACVLLITLIPIPAEGLQKGDDLGQVLNLPPFVDFELKEKRKVDVIVDVGNTSRTVDEINSLVNEVLRPALAADGLDYNIHVEKSSEGKTRQYYGITEVYDNTLALSNTLGLYYFDVETGESGLASTAALDGASALNGPVNILADEKTIVYSSGGRPIRITKMSDFDPEKVKFGTITPFRNGTCSTTGLADPVGRIPTNNIDGYSSGEVRGDFTLTPNNGIIMLSKSQSYEGNKCGHVPYSFLHIDNLDETIAQLDVVHADWQNFVHTGYNVPWSFPYPIQISNFDSFNFRYHWNKNDATDRDSYSWLAKDLSKLYVTKEGGLYVTLRTRIRYYESLQDYINSSGTIPPTLEYAHSGSYGESYEGYWNYNSATRDRDIYYPNFFYKLNPVTGDLIFRETIYSKDVFTLSKIDSKTGQLVKGTMNKGVTSTSRTLSSFKQWIVMSDGTIVDYNPRRTDNPFYKQVIILSDVDAEPYGIAVPDSIEPGTIVGSLGRFVFFKPNVANPGAFLYKLNVDTEEWSVAVPYMKHNRQKYTYEMRLIPYPDSVSSEKRYMSDILQENIARSDAEKYYIRIDDYGLSQLRNGKEVAKLATEMLAQQVTYIPLGNTANQAQHHQLLTTIGNKGRYIERTDDVVAMTEAAAMITNRKEAELHVLIANETLALSTIKSSMTELQTELQGENILTTVNYIQGTSTSKLYELINRIQWHEDRNNYVVLFNRGSMSELDSIDYEMDVANELNQYYAHYISIGTDANAQRNQSLIETMKGNGTTTASTIISNINSTIKQYIMDTAVKNPKRVTDTLVLNYDQTTGAYSSDVLVNTFYSDIEGDPKFNERFKTSHDPTIYENHTGLMEGIGQYQNSPTTQFTKVGKYELVVQVQDNPSNHAAFSNYRQWSLDSLSRLVLFVHRAPIAEFTAIVNQNRQLSITNLSYDLDRYSQRNKGIVSNVWKWKRVEDEIWTEGNPPTTLAANTDYFIALKVKDIDGAWSNEVIKLVSTKDSNQPPVALFVINPATVSWNHSFSITDLSYDPDEDELIAREWQVYREGKQILTKSSMPTTNEIKQAAIQAGYNQLGQYQIRLRVQDSQELWSDWYSDYATIVNHAPIANFEPISVTYRDTLNQIINLTSNPDQDGDAVSYRWKLMKDSQTFNLGTTRDASIRIRDRGLGTQAIGTWLLELRAADPLGAESYMTHSFQVVNQSPTTEITNSPTYGYIDEAYTFTSSSDDPDSEDRSSLQSYWKITSPTGKIRSYYTKNLTNMTFDEKGIHTVEHWVMDQLGAESEWAKTSINILNKKPIAEFTRSPITTYRDINIDFKSLSTDYDGWIETYRYELLRDNLSPLTLSTNADFTRPFSSIGTFDIRHTVMDNDGASDSITKKIYIINRPPRAEVTQPSGTSAATATQFTTATPTIRWTMSDADNDPQVQYQLQLKNEQGTVLRTTAITTTSNKYYTLPSGWVTEGNIYRVSVRVHDGYDWSSYASDKYFYITLNQPPVAGFVISPSILYEGDSVVIHHQVDDPNQDMLDVNYKVISPNNETTHFPNASSKYTLSFQQYNDKAFELNKLNAGAYRIQQTVSDKLADPVFMSKDINVLPLAIVGQVTHTELWEERRQEYNSKLSPYSPKWEANQFFSGEKFMLQATTTLSDQVTQDRTYAVRVAVTLDATNTTVELTNVQHNQWSGSIWESSFIDIPKGNYDFTFQVWYSNGVIKTHLVPIEIIGKATQHAGVQRWK